MNDASSNSQRWTPIVWERERYRATWWNVEVRRGSEVNKVSEYLSYTPWPQPHFVAYFQFFTLPGTNIIIFAIDPKWSILSFIINLKWIWNECSNRTRFSFCTKRVSNSSNSKKERRRIRNRRWIWCAKNVGNGIWFDYRY